MNDPKDKFRSSLIDQTKKARLSIFQRWVVDPSVNRLPDDISFGEWHFALDELEERIQQCREMRSGFFDDEEFKEEIKQSNEDIPF